MIDTNEYYCENCELTYNINDVSEVYNHDTDEGYFICDACVDDVIECEGDSVTITKVF